MLEPSELTSQRVFQKISFPLKKARLTPWSRALVTLVRCAADQYSSWPEEMKTLWLRRRDPFASTSDPLV